MGLMAFITSALGAFYLVASSLALLALQRDWFHGDGTDFQSAKYSPQMARFCVATVSACLYAAAGLSLIIRSGFAVWFFGAGFGLQGVYYAIVWISHAPEEHVGQVDWQKTLNAGILSSASFAFSAYAVRTGILN